MALSTARSLWLVMGWRRATISRSSASITTAVPMATAAGTANPRGCPVQRLHDAVHRAELGLERRPVAAVEPLLPAVRQPPAQPVQHCLDHEGLRAAHEPLDHLGLAQRPAELGEGGGLLADRQALAVDQHAVAVEDDQLQWPGHAGSVRAARHAPTAERIGKTGP
jgi:hypothetical protein